MKKKTRKSFVERILLTLKDKKEEKEKKNKGEMEGKRKEKQNLFFITFWCFDSFSNTLFTCIASIVVFILKLYYKFDDLW